jgi:hypothetical protein
MRGAVAALLVSDVGSERGIDLPVRVHLSTNVHYSET